MRKKYPVRPWKISDEQERAFRANDKTFLWLCDLPPELLRQYAGKWIAARDCRILAAGDTMDALLEALGDTDLESVILDRIRTPEWTIYR